MNYKLAFAVLAAILTVALCFYPNPKSSSVVSGCFEEYGNGTLTLQTYGYPFSVASRVKIQKEDFVCIQAQKSPYTEDNTSYLAILGNAVMASAVAFTAVFVPQKLRSKKPKQS